jgi:hypothetical protein
MQGTLKKVRQVLAKTEKHGSHRKSEVLLRPSGVTKSGKTQAPSLLNEIIEQNLHI